MERDEHTSVRFDRTTNSFVGISPAIMAQLAKTYRGVDINKELAKMSLWLLDKGKLTKGTLTFITNWLSRAHPTISTASDDQSDSPLGHLLNDYLDGLWKNSTHIHTFNKMTNTSSR